MARRKKEDISVHRNNITTVASKIFIEKGITGTTVDEIAKTSGYSKATLYVYFENKEEIYFSLVYQHMQYLYKKIKDIISQEISTKEKWRECYLEICFAIHNLSKEYPIYFDGMIGNINVDIDSAKTPQTYKDIYKLGLDFDRTLKEMINKGEILGIFNSITNSSAVVIFLWSSISGIVRMKEHKKDYYELLGFNNDDFLKQEFLSLLCCCQNIGGEQICQRKE